MFYEGITFKKYIFRMKVTHSHLSGCTPALVSLLLWKLVQFAGEVQPALKEGAFFVSMNKGLMEHLMSLSEGSQGQMGSTSLVTLHRTWGVAGTYTSQVMGSCDPFFLLIFICYTDSNVKTKEHLFKDKKRNQNTIPVVIFHPYF